MAEVTSVQNKFKALLLGNAAVFHLKGSRIAFVQLVLQSGPPQAVPLNSGILLLTRQKKAKALVAKMGLHILAGYTIHLV
ncbi:MAG: hypothetical protein R2787_10895 [Saprospiraceae bacterium]